MTEFSHEVNRDGELIVEADFLTSKYDGPTQMTRIGLTFPNGHQPYLWAQSNDPNDITVTFTRDELLAAETELRKYASTIPQGEH